MACGLSLALCVKLLVGVEVMQGRVLTEGWLLWLELPDTEGAPVTVMAPVKVPLPGPRLGVALAVELGVKVLQLVAVVEGV